MQKIYDIKIKKNINKNYTFPCFLIAQLIVEANDKKELEDLAQIIENKYCHIEREIFEKPFIRTIQEGNADIKNIYHLVYEVSIKDIDGICNSKNEIYYLKDLKNNFTFEM